MSDEQPPWNPAFYFNAADADIPDGTPMARLPDTRIDRDKAEMLELLRDVLAQRNELLMRSATFDSIAALLARFPR